MSKRLKRVRKEIEQLKQRTPYNFCDRWCERCEADIKMKCRLYHDELDVNLMNIAKGRDKDDLDGWKEAFEAEGKRFEEMELLWQHEIDNYEEDYGSFTIDTSEKDREDKKVCDHPLYKTTWQYMKNAHVFLETHFNGKDIQYTLRYAYESIVWYHTLLSTKLYRALCGIYEYKHADDNEIGFCDVVAQFDVCRKGIQKSKDALRGIISHNPQLKSEANALIVLLDNIKSRIAMIERKI